MNMFSQNARLCTPSQMFASFQQPRCERDQWLSQCATFPTAPQQPSENVLLTGANGFLGVHLIQQLQKMQPETTIYCLVHAKTPAEAQSKLYLACQDRGISLNKQRTVVLNSDLEVARFGLCPERWRQLAAVVDTIYHCGARANPLHSYTTLRNANVISTLELLSLCQLGRAKRFFYISSLFAAAQQSNHLYEKSVAESPLIMNGYVQSKWVCERLIEEAFSRGLRGSIYRMGAMTGSTRYGTFNAGNHTLNLIKGCLQLGVAPAWGFHQLDLSPVDLLANLLIHSSINNLHPEQCVNLGYLASIGWRSLFEFLVSRGHRVDLINPHIWARNHVASVNQDNALYPFKPFYCEPDEPPHLVIERQYVKQRDINLNILSLLDTYYRYWSAKDFMTFYAPHPISH